MYVYHDYAPGVKLQLQQIRRFKKKKKNKKTELGSLIHFTSLHFISTSTSVVSTFLLHWVMGCHS